MEGEGGSVDSRAGEQVGESGASYTDEVAREFARGVGDKVLVNGRVFFAALAARGQLGSLEVARMIHVSSPRNIPSVLTTPLKRRAKALGLPLPWRSGADHEDRTLWFDVDGVAARLVTAIDAEMATRNPEARS